jgi:hypothetical protein
VTPRALLALCVPAAACQGPGASTPKARPAPPGQQFALFDLMGGWRWVFHTTEGGTSRIEDETWRLRPDPRAPSHLVGRYLRSVEVRSEDRTPFQCNQRLWYRQRALYDVVVERAADELRVRETAYATEPSPCDHGFRHLGEYRVEPGGVRMILHWDHGSQTLYQTDDGLDPLPTVAWPDTYDPVGPWRWDASSFDADGNIQDEHEWWEITRRTPTRLDLTYRRRVVVRSPDGANIPCAGAPSWTLDDAYVLDGQKEEEHWHFHELAVEPGDHPCVRITPRRTLDEATAEQIGNFLVLEWRGKRREVLYRPDSWTPPQR